MRDVLEGLAEPFEDLKVKGKKTSYLAINGNMFAFVDDGNALCLRVSEADKKAYNELHGTGDVIQYNSVMRGYVRVVDAILSDDKRLRELFATSLAFARSLKPKPTKKSG